MSRHTTFRFCLDPTAEQHEVLARHAGASRFAFNQCLEMVQSALTQRSVDTSVEPPWTQFDLINTFNSWKKSADAGRLFVVDTEGTVGIVATGLAWRKEVYQQVFEEAAVDLGKGLNAWSDSRCGKRRGKRIGFPRFKKKSGGLSSFRLRNKHPKDKPPVIRVGEKDRPRSITLPGIGQIGVHDDTRRLRRMLAKRRARILFATISHYAGRWWISLNVEADALHLGHHHPARGDGDTSGWVGIDRGLSVFLVAATSEGEEVVRVSDAPKALASGMAKQKRLAKSLSRKEKGSQNRRDAAAKLARHHYHVANTRRHFLHRVSGALVKTHDRLVIEDLNVAGMLRNRRLARAISDAGWAEFARLLRYKQTWPGGQVVFADRWYPSSKTCSECSTICVGLRLSDRVFTCTCGHSMDRDFNAAINLARRGQTRHTERDPSRSPDPQREAGSPTPADGTALTWGYLPPEGQGDTPRVLVKPARQTREPTFTPRPRPEPRTPEKGGVDHSREMIGTL
jgi:putative transposase